jgi:hypothetical protein
MCGYDIILGGFRAVCGQISRRTQGLNMILEENSERLSERSAVIRFFKPWFRTWRVTVAALALILCAAAAWIGTRMAAVEIRYSKLNRVTDKALMAEVTSGKMSDTEFARHTTLGFEGAAETLYLPPLIVLKALSTGHQSAIADLLFVRAHSYFLSHFFSDRKFSWLDNYYNAISGLDPDNPRIYLWAAQVTKLGQVIDDNAVNRSNRYLEDGLKRFPRNWQMHLDMGFNLFFEYKGSDDADKSMAKLRARDHFATAAGLPGANIDPNFVAELFERNQEDRLAVAYALQKYYEANDDQRSQLLRRVSSLSDALAQGIRAEEQRWRTGFGYIPVALFALVDDRDDTTWNLLFGMRRLQ